MNGSILTINAGSSSLKFALFDNDRDLTERLRGEIETLDAAPHLSACDAAGKILADEHWAAGTPHPFDSALGQLLGFIGSHIDGRGIAAVGHRIVHGGANHVAPAFVTTGLLQDLTALTPLDPLHMPHNLAPIYAIAAARPDLAQVVCFDTAFHHTLPLLARMFALPRALTDAGIRRYGFHGLSYEYIAGRLSRDAPDLARKKIIAAHLGAGASLCALLNGKSIATSAGFSVLDGLPMATRCGRLDPGIPLYLAANGRSWAQIEDMLYNRSGLLGVSGVSGDVRVLLASGDPHAREAIDLFNYHIACEIGALVSALNGLDGLVFTAGIGEHAPAIRDAVCCRLAWLGVRLDPAANAASAALISTPGSAVAVHVIPTNEELMIATHTQAIHKALVPDML